MADQGALLSAYPVTALQFGPCHLGRGFATLPLLVMLRIPAALSHGYNPWNTNMIL